MIKLIDIIKEIKLHESVPNNLDKLESIPILVDKNDRSLNSKEKRLLAIQCAELVLPIYEYYYPNDKRVRNTISMAKRGTFYIDAEDAYNEAPKNSSAAKAAYAAYIAYVICTTEIKTVYSSFNTVRQSAIEATKLHFNEK